MDYTDRLNAQETETKCTGECQGCEHEQWMKCHEIEVHSEYQEETMYCESDRLYP